MLNETCACQNYVLTLKNVLSVTAYTGFSFSWIQDTFWLLLWLHLTHELLRSFAFNFQISGYLPQYVSSFNSIVVREYTFSFFKCTDLFYGLEHDLGKSSICTCREHVFCCGWVLCTWLSAWQCYLGFPHPYWFFVHLFYPLLRKESCYFQLHLSISRFPILSVFASWVLKLCRTGTSWFRQFDICDFGWFSSCFFSLGFAELLGPVSSEF